MKKTIYTTVPVETQTRETKYYIDYIYDNTTGINFYHQLVRRYDDAILYSNEILENVFLRCWELGITDNDVAVL